MEIIRIIMNVIPCAGLHFVCLYDCVCVSVCVIRLKSGSRKQAKEAHTQYKTKEIIVT